MKALLYRLIGCSMGIMAGSFLFNVRLDVRELILYVVFMTLLYTYLRPLIALIILPVNMFLLGVAGLFADALLVKWAVGHSFGYWQAFFIAVVVYICYLPYGWSKKAISL